MAKGEQKGNRESKKPREEMVKTIAAAPSQKGRSSGLATDIRIGQERCRMTRAGNSFAEAKISKEKPAGLNRRALISSLPV